MTSTSIRASRVHEFLFTPTLYKPVQQASAGFLMPMVEEAQPQSVLPSPPNHFSKPVEARWKSAAAFVASRMPGKDWLSHLSVLRVSLVVWELVLLYRLHSPTWQVCSSGAAESAEGARLAVLLASMRVAGFKQRVAVLHMFRWATKARLCRQVLAP